jgi:uncharacterized protein (TIGR03437 family)
MFRSSGIFAVLTFWTFASPADGQSLSFLPRYVPIGDQCCSALTGDFNRDGKADIVVAHSASSVTVLLGKGDGNFTRIETGQGPGPGPVIDSVIAAADVNSDGIIDLIVAIDGGSGAYALLIGNGDGTFRSPAVLELGGDSIVAVGDFNGDGKPDLLVSPAGVYEDFAARLGNGDGTFQPAGPAQSFPDGDCCFTVVGDFNHDGKADVAQTAVRHSDHVWVWLSDGRGGFQTKSTYSVNGLATNGLKTLAIGDLNRDGNPDLVMGTWKGVGVLLGNGDGTFRSGPSYQVPLLPTASIRGEPLIVADLDGDGVPDVADGFAVLLGNGDGSLQAPVIFGQQLDSRYGPTFVFAADFNGDRRLGLVGTGGNGSELLVLINNSPGTDSSVTGVSAASYGTPVAPGSIVTAFGNGLATSTASASAVPWPTTLDNVRVRVLDQNGVERPAGIIYISPSQINFQIPPGTSEDYAIINVDNGKTPLTEGARATPVKTVAAGFFTADGTGTGIAAATALRVQGDARTPVPVFQCSSTGSCTPVPIDLSVGGAVYLSVYGTGFGNAAQPGCDSMNTAISVSYSGPQGEFPGLDQLNVLLPKTLPHGRVDITCEFQPAVVVFGSLSTASFTIYIK